MSNVCVDKAVLSGHKLHSPTRVFRLLNFFRDSTDFVVFFLGGTYQLQSLDEYGANCFHRYHSDMIVVILQLGYTAYTFRSFSFLAFSRCCSPTERRRLTDTKTAENRAKECIAFLIYVRSVCAR